MIDILAKLYHSINLKWSGQVETTGPPSLSYHRRGNLYGICYTEVPHKTLPHHHHSHHHLHQICCQQRESSMLLLRYHLGQQDSGVCGGWGGHQRLVKQGCPHHGQQDVDGCQGLGSSSKAACMPEHQSTGLISSKSLTVGLAYPVTVPGALTTTSTYTHFGCLKRRKKSVKMSMVTPYGGLFAGRDRL